MIECKGSANSPLIFVVEDNFAYRFLVGKVLERKGYRVMTFEHGEKAANMMNTIKPCLILSDIEMPHMDGFEFHAHLQKNFGDLNIPFLYFSSTNKEIYLEKAAELSEKEVLKKPVKAQVLTDTIEEILGSISTKPLVFE